MLGCSPHALSARRRKSSSSARIVVDADRLLEAEHEPGADRLDDRRRAALLAVRGIGEVPVLERVHVRDGAAADDIRNGVGEDATAHHQHARRARAADELVRREEHRVEPASRHVDVDVRRGGGEVPERERAVIVQQLGDSHGVGDDAGDVARGAERADLERPVGVAARALRAGSRGRRGRRRPRGWSRRPRSTRATAARCCGARTGR